MEAKLPSSGEGANWIHTGDLTGVGAEGCISIVGHIDDLRGRLRGTAPVGSVPLGMPAASRPCGIERTLGPLTGVWS